MPRRLFRKAVQQGRSERRGDAYSGSYVEPLSEARTPLAGFVNSLLVGVEACGDTLLRSEVLSRRAGLSRYGLANSLVTRPSSHGLCK